MATTQKVQNAVLDWLNGEVDHIQLVRTKDGHEHVLRWTHEKKQETNADKRS